MSRFRKSICFIIVVVFLAVVPEAGAETIYVDVNAKGDGSGSDWENAATTITAGLASAATGDEVWVKAGTYGEAISLESGIGVYGGFPSEGTPAFPDRDPGTHTTTIDGSEQFTSVVLAEQIIAATLDGFTITGGYTPEGGGLYCDSASVDIRSCTITGNTATRTHGGGVYLAGVRAPAFTDCTIRDNSTREDGVGIYCLGVSPRLVRCVIEKNRSPGYDGNGGGIYCAEGSSPELIDCTIRKNVARAGGGMYCVRASPTLIRCLIQENGALGVGGVALDDCSSTLIGCVIEFNASLGYQTGGYGGGLGNYTHRSSLLLRECTIRGNSASHGAGLRLGSGKVQVERCIIESNTGRNGGGGVDVSGANVEIVNCLLTGNSSDMGAAVKTDRGTLSLVNCTVVDNAGGAEGAVNLGYETVSRITNCILWNQEREIGGAGSNAAVVEYSCVRRGRQGVGNVDAQPQFVDWENDDYRLQDGSPCIDSGIEYATAAVDLDGNPRPGTDGLMDMGAYESPPEYTGGPGEHVPGILHVRAGAPAGGDGTTWGSAFREIMTAMRVAGPWDEIWVAGGTYYESVRMEATTSLYGGFGGDETSREERDWVANPTVIDATGRYTSAVTAGATTEIDGFTITRGVGGISCDGVSPVIRNCRIVGSRDRPPGGAWWNVPGGVYGLESSLRLTRCTIEGNRGGGVNLFGEGSPLISECTIRENSAGSGVHSDDSSPTVVRCLIEDNSSKGGVYLSGEGSSLISECTIRGNRAVWGGGIRTANTAIRIERCVIDSNRALAYGGGLAISSATAELVDCLVTSNRADTDGGALHLGSANAEAVNCVFARNSSERGGAVHFVRGALDLVHCTLIDNESRAGGGMYVTGETNARITNCILWNLGSEIAGSSTDAAAVEYSCVQGGWPGEGNVDTRPLFVDEENGDYRLRNGSPGIDIGKGYVTHPADLDGNARPGADGLTDMGAYESPPEYTGGPGVHIPALIHVRTDAPGGGDGKEWSTAFRTMTGALRVASSSDEIWVSGGTYPELVRMEPNTSLYGGFDGTETLREERDWAVNRTVIDASGLDRGAVGAADEAILDGFAVTGGTADDGGGIYGDHCSPEIRNCSIVENTAEYGGGMFWLNSSPKLIGCTIEGNAASKRGGGMRFYGESSPVIMDCTIRGNSGGEGGGMDSYQTSLLLVRCLIEANTVGNGKGGGVSCYGIGTSARFIECRFRENESAQGSVVYSNWTSTRFERCVIELNLAWGEGAFFFFNVEAEIMNCLFVGNYGGKASVIRTRGGMSKLVNCTLVDNESQSTTAVSIDENALCVMINCILWNRGGEIAAPIPGGVSVEYSCIQGGWPGEGNIDAAPLFVDRENGDYRLQNGSPGIDVGIVTSEVSLDLDGNPRPGADGLTDMGAYESPPEYEGDGGAQTPGIIHVRADAPDGGDGGSWSTAYRHLETALRVAGGSDEIWVAEGVYWEAVVLEAGIPMYGGFSGAESAREERDWLLNDTVIDATGLGRTAVTGAAGAVLDGFTITGGDGESGGGVLISGAPTELRNCMVVRNRGYRGGGIFARDSSAPIHLQNCTITGNVATERGGGLAVDGVDLVELIDCVVSGNTASSNGGGISSFWSSFRFWSCSILDNVSGTGGGGVYLYGNSGDAPTHISRTLIAGNKAGGWGGGIVTSGTFWLDVVSSVIVRNEAPSIGGVSSDVNSVLMTNCTVADNSPPGCSFTDSRSPYPYSFWPEWLIQNSIISNRMNDGGLEVSWWVKTEFSFVEGGRLGEGNIRRRPIFVDEAGGDYRLADGSPGIDAGRVDGAPGSDIDGRPRPGGDGLVDIGAYESPPEYTEDTPDTPRVFHVRWDAAEGGDGSSWERAFRRIKSALDLAAAQDEIRIASGTYNERPFIAGGVSVSGGFQGLGGGEDARDRVAFETIIDATGLETREAVVLSGSAVFDGFTVKHGAVGILCENGSQHIRNCTIVGNGSEDYYSSAGIFYHESAGTIRDCTIAGNESRGLRLEQSPVTVAGCVITENEGGAAVSGSDVTFANCIISDNTTAGVGGGVTGGGGPLRFLNTTITGNAAPEIGGVSNWIFTMENSILWGNSNSEVDSSRPLPLVQIRWSNVEGGFPGPGNIDADPLFVNPAGGDYRLTAGSPCIDAGSNEAAAGIAADFDGNIRIWDGDDIPGAVVDMGAYEFGSFPFVPGDTDGDGVVTAMDLFYFSLWWQGEENETNFRCDRLDDGVIDEYDLNRLMMDWK